VRDLLTFAVSHPITLMWFAVMMFKAGQILSLIRVAVCRVVF
jgi:hypothetical protein